jgi:NADH dehydrogenase/NADH:ubiquinone oxidoreductase subunit G
MAAIPLLTNLPSPALSTDTEDVFNSKTDATLLAQQTFVNVDMNTKVIPGINQASTDVAAAKDAAAQSASDAAGSANAANTSKLAAAQSATDATNNGAQQVNLAKDQVTLANQARAAAQAAAAAAGAAAGLPALNGAGNVLAINSNNNGVEFTSLTPLLHATALLF